MYLFLKHRFQIQIKRYYSDWKQHLNKNMLSGYLLFLNLRRNIIIIKSIIIIIIIILVSQMLKHCLLLCTLFRKMFYVICKHKLIQKITTFLRSILKFDSHGNIASSCHHWYPMKSFVIFWLSFPKWKQASLGTFSLSPPFEI